MRDTFKETIRHGIVSSINYENCTAQVTFPDREDIVTRDLPILQNKTQDDQYYYMPDVGERVYVLMDPVAPSRGVILGSYYDDKRQPIDPDPNKTYISFKDGTVIEYDRADHELYISIPNGSGRSILVHTNGDIEVETDGELKIKSAKEITINTDHHINITASKSISIDATEEVTIAGRSVSILERG